MKTNKFYSKFYSIINKNKKKTNKNNVQKVDIVL